MAGNPLAYMPTAQNAGYVNPLNLADPYVAAGAANNAATVQNYRDAASAVADPKTWQDAANQYAGALLAGSISPEAAALRIGKYAKQIGFSVSQDGSNMSRSQYLFLTHDALPDGLKIRISDHDLPPSYGPPGDYDVNSGHRISASNWHDVVGALANKVGADVPAPVQKAIDGAAAADAGAQKMKFQDPSYQEGVLRQTYPAEWASQVEAQDGAARSSGRRDLAARYEATNPGVFQWAPYLRPR